MLVPVLVPVLGHVVVVVDGWSVPSILPARSLGTVQYTEQRRSPWVREASRANIITPLKRERKTCRLVLTGGGLLGSTCTSTKGLNHTSHRIRQGAITKAGASARVASWQATAAQNFSVWARPTDQHLARLKSSALSSPPCGSSRGRAG